jgi:hypothetical protein
MDPSQAAQRATSDSKVTGDHAETPRLLRDRPIVAIRRRGIWQRAMALRSELMPSDRVRRTLAERCRMYRSTGRSRRLHSPSEVDVGSANGFRLVGQLLQRLSQTSPITASQETKVITTRR